MVSARNARLVGIAALLTCYSILAGFDLTHHAVPPGEIRDAGPAKDEIPALTEPRFVQAAEVTFLDANDRVIGLVIQGRARAYAVKILNWHEVVNDIVAGVPLAVTFCPLVQDAAVYQRDIDGKTLEFGVSGKLYQGNLVLYDRNTQSLWAQLDGKALAGPMAGKRLRPVPVMVSTWEAWRRKYPSTDVLSMNTGYSRDYGVDPYWGYEHGDEVVSPLTHLDERLRAHEPVLGISVGGEYKAFPLSRLSGAKSPVGAQVGGVDVTIAYDPNSGAASASIAGERIALYNGYWFAWAAFHPNTTIWDAPDGKQP